MSNQLDERFEVGDTVVNFVGDIGTVSEILGVSEAYRQAYVVEIQLDFESCCEAIWHGNEMSLYIGDEL